MPPRNANASSKTSPANHIRTEIFPRTEMPRLTPQFIRRAHHISPQLAKLLPVCRDLASAQNELRWIRQHAEEKIVTTTTTTTTTTTARSQHGHPSHHQQQRQIESLTARLCARRGRGEPLQYILGTQPFGGDGILHPLLCQPGVLIPRADTEAWASHLAARLTDGLLLLPASYEDDGLRVVDMCTGTGCVALLLHAILARSGRFGGGSSSGAVRTWGFDVDEGAVRLARRNLRAHEAVLLRGEGAAAGSLSIRFERADIFSDAWIEMLEAEGAMGGRRGGSGRIVDVLVCNPPYISESAFRRTTERSVRNHEPRLALVPTGAAAALHLAASTPSTRRYDGHVAPEDVFYARVLEVARVLRPKVMVFEVGDLEQAIRVGSMAAAADQAGDFEIQIWRDEPDGEGVEEMVVAVGGAGGSRTLKIVGSGNGRSVFMYDTRP